MLEKIIKPRKNKNVFFYFFSIILSALIILVFVFMGVFPDPIGNTKGIVAVVNQKNISVRQLQTYLDQALKNFPSKQRDLYSNLVRQQILKSLISEEALAQAVMDLKLKVAPREIKEVLLNFPYFKQNGFNMSLYQQFLSYLKLSSEEFEEQITKGVLLERFRKLVKNSVDDKEEKKFISEASKLYFSYFSLNLTDLSQKSLKGTDIRNFSKNNRKTLKSYYDKNSFLFSEKDELKASHILFKTEGKKDSEVRKKAQSLLKTLKPSNFSQMAKTYSEDPGSRLKGGDLGYFKKGVMTPAFEKAAFSLKKGQISSLVKTPFGYHVIYLTDKKSFLFDKNINEVSKKYLEENRKNLLKEKLQRLVKQKKYQSLEAYLKKQNFSWKKNKLFSFKDSSSSSFLKAMGQSYSLIESDGKSFLVRSAGVKKDKKQKVFNLHNEFSESIGESFLNQFRKKSRIQVFL